MTTLTGHTLLQVSVICLRLCEFCSFTGEIRLKMGRDMRKQSQLFGSRIGSPDHSEFALCIKKPHLCMTLGTGTGRFCQFHTDKNFVGSGREESDKPSGPSEPRGGRRGCLG